MSNHFSTSPGVIRIFKNSTGDFDPFLVTTNSVEQQFLVNKLSRLIAFSPFFDAKTSWYPNALLYIDSYAIYPDGNFGVDVVTDHPEWILKDSGGSLLHIPWGDNSQYAADFSNAEFRAFWIAGVQAILAGANYKGLFVDDVNMDWKVSDASGTFVNPRDVNTGAAMTQAHWREYMANWMEAIRAAFPSIEICHNSIWYAGLDDNWYQTNTIARQIQAADTQFIEFGVNDGGLTGGTGNFSIGNLFQYVDAVNNNSHSVVLSNIGAGSTSDEMALVYGLAGYYLINNNYNYAGDAGMAYDPSNLYSGWELDLGAPLSARTYSNGIWTREFSGGKVLLAEPGTDAQVIDLGGTFYNLDNVVSNYVVLAENEAAILIKRFLKNPESLSLTFPDYVLFDYAILVTRLNGDVCLFWGAEDQTLSYTFYRDGAWSETAMLLGEVNEEPLDTLLINENLYLLSFIRSATGEFNADTGLWVDLGDVFTFKLTKIDSEYNVIYRIYVATDLPSVYASYDYYNHSWIRYENNQIIITALDNSQWIFTETIPPTILAITQGESDALILSDTVTLRLTASGNVAAVSFTDSLSLSDRLALFQGYLFDTDLIHFTDSIEFFLDSPDLQLSMFDRLSMDDFVWTIWGAIVSYSRTAADLFSLSDSLTISYTATDYQNLFQDNFNLNDSIFLSLSQGTPPPIVVQISAAVFPGDVMSMSDHISERLTMGGDVTIDINIKNDGINICIKKFFIPS